MFQSNPFLTDKYVISKEVTFEKVIRLLTHSDAVDIQFADIE